MDISHRFDQSFPECPADTGPRSEGLPDCAIVVDEVFSISDGSAVKAYPVVAPSRVLLDQPEDELFEFWIHDWLTEGICPGVGPLLGDQHSEPSQQGVVRNNGA